MAAQGSVIFNWLERLGLGYSVPAFQAMGITTTSELMSLTVEDYDAGTRRPRPREWLPRVLEESCSGSCTRALGGRVRPLPRRLRTRSHILFVRWPCARPVGVVRYTAASGGVRAVRYAPHSPHRPWPRPSAASRSRAA
jgi:hypothetical protein